MATTHLSEQSVNTTRNPVRTLVHPPIRHINPNGAQVDVLFLYRSPKKHDYFCQVAAEALTGYHCAVVSYHNLPAVETGKVAEPDEAVMQSLLAQAHDELFSARDAHWIKHLRSPLMALRRIQIRKIYVGLNQLLSQLQPKMIVLWNGSKFQDHILHAANHKGIPVAYFENGLLPGTTTMDFNGINAAASVPKNRCFYMARPERPFSLAPVADRKPRAGRRRQAAADSNQTSPGALKILVPFQKERDTQILNHSPWLKSMPQLFGAVLEAVAQSGLENCEITFREHPSSATGYPLLHKRVQNLANVCFDNQPPIAEALSNADVVITINSSVGMEALLSGKKVITLGDAFYNVDGLVLHAMGCAALADTLRQVHLFELEQDLKQRFVEYLANDYVVPGDWRNASRVHFQALAERFSGLLSDAVPAPGADSDIVRSYG